MSHIVQIRSLCKAYGRGALTTPVLREVSMNVERGTFTAVVGPSGCGKTTLLALLGGLDRGDSGSVVVDGLDLIGASARELTEYRRRSVGFVFQSYNLLPSLTALENVESGLEFLPGGASVRRTRAMEYLARVGMVHFASRFPAQLSGGQQQRVAVARALAREPKVLLADEPTGNLDAESGELVFSCIRGLQRTSGITCIMVTHDADLAERTDGVVSLREGHIIQNLERSGEVLSLRARRQSGEQVRPRLAFRR